MDLYLDTMGREMVQNVVGADARRVLDYAPKTFLLSNAETGQVSHFLGVQVHKFVDTARGMSFNHQAILDFLCTCTDILMWQYSQYE